jgi:hypothetical protein
MDGDAAKANGRSTLIGRDVEETQRGGAGAGTWRQKVSIPTAQALYKMKAKAYVTT